MKNETGSHEGVPALAAEGIRPIRRFTTHQKGTSMKTLRTGLTALVGATLLLVALPGLASAATTGTTTTTFTLTGGAMSITVPSTTVNLGSASVAAGSLTAQLGTVSVNDGRGLLSGGWTSSVTASKFTTGAATAAETIAATNVDYWSGAATATSGLGILLGGQLTSVLAVVVNTAQTAFTGGSLIGNNSASWNPTLVVTIPAAAVVGTYTGTVSHTVA
ncbi:MAG: hypothetical protein QOD62_1600 [Actinomycetota bacterium]|nr:hypothetical protein [Actinomycetota bacterium]